jgi:hypothetical protein
MTSKIWTPEKAAEFSKLYDQFTAAMQHATGVLRAKGMDSEEFRHADAAAGDLWVKLRAMQGVGGKHRMA